MQCGKLHHNRPLQHQRILLPEALHETAEAFQRLQAVLANVLSSWHPLRGAKHSIKSDLYNTTGPTDEAQNTLSMWSMGHKMLQTPPKKIPSRADERRTGIPDCGSDNVISVEEHLHKPRRDESRRPRHAYNFARHPHCYHCGNYEQLSGVGARSVLRSELRLAEPVSVPAIQPLLTSTRLRNSEGLKKLKHVGAGAQVGFEPASTNLLIN